MIKVIVNKRGHFAVNASLVKKELKTYLEKRGLVSDFIVSVTFVGEKAMQNLAKKYLGENSVHNVLSFPESELRGEFAYPNDQVLPLGEIVICYPKAVEEANSEGKLIDNKSIELIKHGAQHLLGEHHN